MVSNDTNLEIDKLIPKPPPLYPLYEEDPPSDNEVEFNKKNQTIKELIHN